MPTTIIEELDFLDQSEFIIFESAGEFVCDASKAKTVSITFEATGELVVTTTADLSAEVIFESEGEFVCNAFIGPNIFTDELIFEAAGEFECTPSISSENLIIIESAGEFECNAEVITPERFYWNVLINTVPAIASGVYRKFAPAKLTVDGNELPVENWEYTEQSNEATQRLTISLARIADRDAITSTSSVKFEVGEYLSGVLTWTTLIDTGETASQNYSITYNRDSSSFTCTSGGNVRLRTVPTTDLVLYDSAQMTLSAADFEPIPDNEGNLIATERKSFWQMTLYDLLDELFVTRAGFSGIETNIEDFRVSRLDIQAGTRFVDAVGGVIGMFEPTFREGDSGQLIIRDTTEEVDSGDPAGIEIDIADSSSVTVGWQRQFDRIDVIRLRYAASRREYDYTQDRQTSVTTPYGQFGSGNFQEVTVTKNFRDYFRNSDPFNAIDTDLMSVETTTVKNGVTVFESEENYTYDGFGNPTARTKSYSKRLPDIENGGTVALLTVKTENENWEYKPHPFQTRAKYLAKHEVYERGMRVTDSLNQQLGEDWSRDYEHAYRGGNLIDGMTVALAPLRTLVEQYRPLRGGKAEVSVYEVDEAGNDPVVIQDDTQIVAGEIATNALTKQQLTMLVHDGTGINPGSRFADLNAGELPPTRAKQLALRKIRKSRRAPKTASLEIAGLRPDLKKGIAFEPKGRGGESLGNYQVSGIRIRGDRTQILTTVEGEEL